MSWASHAIETLGKGQIAKVRPRGHSMKGKVEDGALVTLEPCDPATLAVGDVVLVRVHGQIYLHLIKAINQQRYLISNNRGGINGWVGPNAIYGRAIKIE